MKTMNDLTLQLMQDVYYAERQILKALPKLAKAAESQDLKQAFTHHREETESQVERLQKAFDAFGKRARGTTCEAINGIIEEGEEIIENFEAGAVRDAGLIAAAQAVEHYEMARYGTLIAWAKIGGHQEIVKLMQETLEEEKKAELAAQSARQRAREQAGQPEGRVAEPGGPSGAEQSIVIARLGPAISGHVEMPGSRPGMTIPLWPDFAPGRRNQLCASRYAQPSISNKSIRRAT